MLTKTRGSPRRRWARRLGILAMVGAVLLVLVYALRAPLLSGLAEAWIVEEPIDRADAIVVLGGGLENRPFAAAKLFHAGVAPRILYMDVQPTPTQELGLTQPESELTREILLRNGVPESALERIGDGVASTYDESEAVRQWTESSGATSIVIPTDLFHTRRVRWLFEKRLDGTGTESRVIPVNPIRYGREDWWRHEEGIIAFQNEVIKLIYYRLKY